MQIIRTLHPAQIEKIHTYIHTRLLPMATEEEALCARGRLNLWLQAEPIYHTRKYRPAHSDERLWKLCKQIYPGADLAQVYFAQGGHGIDWHRDAAYAMPQARILNLGAVCLETRLSNRNIIRLELSGGEIIQFNSKLEHRALPRSDERIGIGLWKAKIPITNPHNWE